MVDRKDIIARLSSKVMSKGEFDFERLSAPPLYSFIDQQRINQLYNIAKSVKYSGNPKKKYKAMDDILNPLGFKKLSAGTNRVVYKHMERNDIVLKVAADAVGLGDNPAEYINQFKLKPFCTKVFEVDPTGTVALVERVYNLRNREEFLSVASDYYDLLRNYIIGHYVMADIGVRFFMNVGVRFSFGLVLLDYPYLYELDGNKLYCTSVNENGEVCGGEIDYDDGFNYLYCEKCKTRYRARQLGKNIEKKIIIAKKGANEMEEINVKINGLRLGPALDTDGLLPKAKAVYVKSEPNVGITDVPDNMEIKVNIKASGQTKKEKPVKEMERGQVKASANSHESQQSKNIKVKENNNNVEMTFDQAKEKYGQKIIEGSGLQEELSKALNDLHEVEEKVEFLKSELEREQKYSNDLKEKLNKIEDEQENKEDSVDEIALIKENNAKLIEENKNLVGSNEFKDGTIKELTDSIEVIKTEKIELAQNYEAKLATLEGLLQQKDDELINAQNNETEDKSSLPVTIDQTYSPDIASDTTTKVSDMYFDDADTQFTFINCAITTLNAMRRSLSQKEFEEDMVVLVTTDLEGNVLEDSLGNKIVIYSINNKFVDDIFSGEVNEFSAEALERYNFPDEEEIGDDEVVESEDVSEDVSEEIIEETSEESEG